MTPEAKKLADSLHSERQSIMDGISRLANQMAALDGPEADMSWRLLHMAQLAVEKIGYRDLMEIAGRNT
jgi:hypothetical protein